MTLTETKKYLDALPLSNALWWFIENIGSDHKHRDRLFFHLRERISMQEFD